MSDLSLLCSKSHHGTHLFSTKQRVSWDRMWWGALSYLCPHSSSSFSSLLYLCWPPYWLLNTPGILPGGLCTGLSISQKLLLQTGFYINICWTFAKWIRGLISLSPSHWLSCNKNQSLQVPLLDICCLSLRIQSPTPACSMPGLADMYRLNYEAPLPSGFWLGPPTSVGFSQ